MIDDLTPAQRESLEALRTSRGACPPAGALVEYESLSAADRERHRDHAHIQVCSRCQLALLHMAEPAKASSSMMKWMLPLAAIVVLAIGFTVVDRRSGTVVPETVRGTEIQPIAPIGTIETPVPEFSWQSPIRVERYRITLYENTKPVWQAETTATRITPPNGVIRLGQYRWIVEGIDREGDVRITSPPQSFQYFPRVY